MRIKKLKKNLEIYKDKNIILTGATGGLGRELLKYYLKAEANVIMAVRNKDKAIKLLNSIKNQCNTEKAKIYHLNLSDFKNTLDFCDRINTDFNKIDLLINNAGVYNVVPTLTEDNLELHIAVNYINTLFLTENILNKINQACGKVVFVSSVASNYFKFKKHNDFLKSSKLRCYAESKKLTALSALYLSRQNQNKNVKIALMHPGVAATDIVKNGNFFYSKIATPAMRIIFSKPKNASIGVILAAVDNIPYGYWLSPKFFSVWGKPKKRRIFKQIQNIKNQEYAYGFYKTISENLKSKYNIKTPL